MTKALFGAGCFWGVEEYFRKINGIQETKVGYAGGNIDNPSYEIVCTGTTNHAEVVLVDFDENKLTYKDVIDHFWKCHDPTQINQQGPDIGTQYRSVIFSYSEDQKKIAMTSKNYIQNIFNKPIFTEITKAKKFFVAEDYHQCYIQKNFNN